MIQKLTEKMIEYYTGDPKRIQHFIKVHAFSRYIGLREQLPEQEQFLLECAALVHDIGIKPAEAQFGECGGKLQERLGPPEAEKFPAYHRGYLKPAADVFCGSAAAGAHSGLHRVFHLSYSILHFP